MRYILILFIFFNVNYCFGQNLVPNPSFENYDTCPNNFAQLNFLKNWYSPTDGTPDFLNSCFNSSSWYGMDVPQNIFGFQNAHSGNSYVQIIPYSSIYLNSREYISCHLKEPLSIGTKYYLSFYVSLADSSNFAISNLGILLHKDSIHYAIQSASSLATQGNNNLNNILLEKNNWIRIPFSFVADSIYQFLTIGNFLTDQQSNIVNVNNGGFPQYYTDANYYIDDVCLSTDSTFCTNWTKTETTIDLASFQLLPNPCSDIIYLTDASFPFKVIIYDEIGYPIITTNNNNSIDISKIHTGVYYVNYINKKTTITKKIMIIH